MLTKDRSDFIYTLEDDEKRCLASIEKVERNIRNRITTRNHGHISADPKISLGKDVTNEY